jgi:hypothetical protein
MELTKKQEIQIANRECIVCVHKGKPYPCKECYGDKNHKYWEVREDILGVTGIIKNKTLDEILGLDQEEPTR